jgi:hypothetical protein
VFITINSTIFRKDKGLSDRKRLADAVEVLANLVRNIHLRRVLSTVCADPHLSFWRLIYGDLTDIVVLEWCKLFGSDDEEHQSHHWKNIASDQAKFRRELFSRLGIYESKWHSYWNEMKRYRDQSVAHHDIRRSEIKNYPKFDLALESSYFYYEFIVGELRKMGIEQQPSDLREYSKLFAAQCRDIAIAAMKATETSEKKFD